MAAGTWQGTPERDIPIRPLKSRILPAAARERRFPGKNQGNLQLQKRDEVESDNAEVVHYQLYEFTALTHPRSHKFK
jgi:hypothetical protein